jgi:hypothetical protein
MEWYPRYIIPSPEFYLTFGGPGLGHSSLSSPPVGEMSGHSIIQTEDFPNPDVYLNHLPSFEAQQIEISRNIVVTVLGVSLKTLFFSRWFL